MFEPKITANYQKSRKNHKMNLFQISKLDMSETQDVTDFDSTEDFVSDGNASLNESDSFNISDYSDE